MIGNATYHVIRDKADYKLAHDFIRQEGQSVKGLTFPTILAIDEDGEIVGMLGTAIQKDMIIAGPFIIKNGLRGYKIIVRLVDLYDAVMRGVGVKSYIYSVPENDKGWLRMVDRAYGATPYAKKHNHLFFIKRLEQSPQAEANNG